MPSSRKRSRDRHSRRRSKSGSNSRSRKRSRSRHRSRDRKFRKKSRSPRKEKREPSVEKKKQSESTNTSNIGLIREDGKPNWNLLTQECEEIITKRRERVEQWRIKQKERKAKEILEGKHRTPDVEVHQPGKKWNLDDDDDDDEVTAVKYGNSNDEEEDTLELFMNELNKNNGSDLKVEEKGSAKIIKSKKKRKGKNEVGELMEQNADAMEYSTEEEEETLESISVIAKKDKLPVVDHSKVYYQKAQKNFYIEVDELKKMSPAEVSKYRNSLGGIKVKGKDCPKPIKTWAQCGLTSKTLAILKMHKFLTPTPIQCQAIPAVMNGRDVISVAKTGSGKTLAYLLPLLRHVKSQQPVKQGDGPIALIIVPTRELAVQIYREISKLVPTNDLRFVCIYGGTVISEQIAKLKNGAEILVCTPGRMIDMLAVNGGRVTNLRRTTFVVLDEADRMFDMGFEPQVTTILARIRPDRQTVMFSATFPRKMEALARKTLSNPIEIEVGGKSVVCNDVNQNALILSEDEKFVKLLELLGVYQEEGKVIVFVEKQENADNLVSQLIRFGYNSSAAVHGGIIQDDRDSFISHFKAGKFKLLVATSVAARGLDISDLNLVVNYDCPNHYEDYVHRCGRTGRAGNKGIAYTFITPDQEKYIGDVIKAFKLSGATPPEQLVSSYNQYLERMKKEDKKVFKNSGFKGKGFQFDEAETQLAVDKRKFEKDTLGLNDSDEETNIDEKITDMFAVKKNVTSVDKNSFNVNNLKQVPDLKDASKKLEAAKQLAMKLDAQKLGGAAKDQTMATTEALFGGSFILGGGVGGGNSLNIGSGMSNKGLNSNPVSGKDLAAQKAEELHSKLGYTRTDPQDGLDASGQPLSGGNGASGSGTELIKKYEEELVINDFPNNVRYRLTSKETMSNLSEFYEVGVSVRGIYMTAGQKAKMEANGERPLYLCIEALSEMKIQAARNEIKRLVKEELMRLQKCNSHNVFSGRYRVL